MPNNGQSYPRGNNFYPDAAIDEEMDLQDGEIDFDDMEDEVAVITKGNQFNKKSPNSMTSSTRKGTNLANISNTIQGNNVR